MNRLGEFDLIAQWLKPLAATGAALGLADDAALIDGPTGEQWVIAKDAIIQNVHFRSEDPPDSVAWKLVATNLSDLAAMGAEPAYYLSVIARSHLVNDVWLDQFAKGLAAIQAEFGLQLLGGDTVSIDGPVVLTCTIIGKVPAGQALLRSGAQADDLIFVSGTLGDAALGLRVLRGLAAADEDRIFLGNRYQRPQPRVQLGMALRGMATAAIDISDGLAADMDHIARCSGLAAQLHATDLPLSTSGRRMPNALDAAISGGDDYELLFTAPAKRQGDIAAVARRCGVDLTVIGRMYEGAGVEIIGKDGDRLKLVVTGWQHA